MRGIDGDDDDNDSVPVCPVPQINFSLPKVKYNNVKSKLTEAFQSDIKPVSSIIVNNPWYSEFKVNPFAEHIDVLNKNKTETNNIIVFFTGTTL